MTPGALSLIVTNARIRTGNPSRPWATALGISDDKLAVIGMAAEILKMANADTRVIDASGQSVSLPAEIIIGSRVDVIAAPDGTVEVTSSPDSQ